MIIKPSPRRGIFFLLTAMLVFSLLNALIKGETTRYNPLQLVFFRCFFASIPAGLFLLVRGERISIPFSIGKLYFIRALLIVTGFSLLFTGIGQLSLSNSMALYFSSTIFLVILSYPILKEKVSVIQWISVGIGMLGITLIAKPTGGVFHWGALCVILGAALEAGNNLLGRLIMLSSHQNGYVLTFVGSLLPAILVLFPLYFVWISPDLRGWIFLILLGLGGGTGQLCITFAYTHAPAGILAPMVYSAMVWSVLLDILLYQVWPTSSLFIGCGIIIVSGLLIFFSEKQIK